jgi:hypothetical protein
MALLQLLDLDPIQTHFSNRSAIVKCRIKAEQKGFAVYALRVGDTPGSSDSRFLPKRVCQYHLLQISFSHRRASETDSRPASSAIGCAVWAALIPSFPAACAIAKGRSAMRVLTT